MGAILLVVYVASTNKPNIDTLPEDGSSADYSVQARIIEGDELYKKLDGGLRYDQLSKDLLVFAKKQYPEYASPDKVVGFDPDDTISSDGDIVKINGKFGSSNNTIYIEITKLKNFRIRTSITDQKTRANIDPELPSNSKRNQLIAGLPLSTEFYTVDYKPDQDSFLLTIYSRDRTIVDASVAELATKLGATDLSKERVSIIYQGGASGRSLAE
jgi:hypothetical protein